LMTTGDFHEIILVNDGSTDASVEIIRRFEDVHLIEHPYNMGNGAAIKSGLRVATGDFILLMDADGQHPVSEIKGFCKVSSERERNRVM